MNTIIIVSTNLIPWEMILKIALFMLLENIKQNTLITFYVPYLV